MMKRGQIHERGGSSEGNHQPVLLVAEMSAITTPELELVVARHFNPRANIIVPNVSWGLGLRYEADVVVLRPSGYAIEIELKVSASDLRADARKKGAHCSNLFRELWFAVPDGLENHAGIPARAGILKAVRRGNDGWRLQTHRRGRLNTKARRLTEYERVKLLHLGVMRIWSLKETLQTERKKRR